MHKLCLGHGCCPANVKISSPSHCPLPTLRVKFRTLSFDQQLHVLWFIFFYISVFLFCCTCLLISPIILFNNRVPLGLFSHIDIFSNTSFFRDHIPLHCISHQCKQRLQSATMILLMRILPLVHFIPQFVLIFLHRESLT